MFLHKSCFLISLITFKRITGLTMVWTYLRTYEASYWTLLKLHKLMLRLKITYKWKSGWVNCPAPNGCKFSTFWWGFTAKSLYFTTWLRNYPNLHKTKFNKTYKIFEFIHYLNPSKSSAYSHINLSLQGDHKVSVENGLRRSKFGNFVVRRES